MIARKRVGVLISGRGSNMAALIAAAGDPAYPAEIAALVSNRPDAEGLAVAKAEGIQTLAIDHKSHATRESFDAALHGWLVSRNLDLIACAGFMRIMTAGLVEAWRDRMINIHPSLLPSYRGLNTHERALADGVKIHGCTVHFVRHEVDAGPIIAQAAVAVLPDDTAESLAERVLAAEHILYPHALALVASGRARVDRERVIIEPAYPPSPPLIVPPPSLSRPKGGGGISHQ